MKLNTLDHPKTFDLADRLGVGLAQTLGHLTLLWAFTGRKAPQGNIGKWPDGAIARACDWQGDSKAFVEALVDAGFVDRHPDHRLLVHHWSDHAERWVRASLKKLGQDFISGNTEPTTEPTVVATTEASPCPVLSRPDKKEKKVRADALAKPDYLQADVWDDFIAFRKQTKFPLTPSAWKSIDKELRAGIDKLHDPNVMISEAMAAGWRGFRLDWYENRIRPNKVEPKRPEAREFPA